MTAHISPSAAVRARLKHPIIDSDGHTVEFVPAFLDYLKQVGGPKLLERFGAAWEEGNRSWGDQQEYCELTTGLW